MEYISYIGELILLANVVIYFIFLAKRERVYKIFTVYLAYIFVIEVLFHILRNQKVNNLFLSHFYFIGQSVLLNYFYFKLLQSKQAKTVFVIVNAALVLSFLVYNFYSPFTVNSFNYFEVFVSNFTIITSMLLYQYDSMERNRQFEYSTIGFLIYFISTTIIFLSGNLLIALHAPEYTKYVWLINALLFVTLQCFLLFDSAYALRKLSGTKMAHE